MHVRVYTSGNKEENYVLEQFHKGCPEDSVIVDLDDYEPSDIAVVFGTYKRRVPISYRRGHVIKQQSMAGLRTVIIETGYINRGAGPRCHYAVGFDGINGRADFRNENMPGDRAKPFLHKLKPWREHGDHIVLCGQVPWDASVQHIEFVKWAQETANIILGMSDRDIVYRSHPLAKTPTPYGARTSQNYWLEDDLKNCWCVVTFNSNSGVEAVMSGVPAVAMDEGSMLKEVANTLGEVPNPRLPDREQWLNNLTYAQWTPEEMGRGEAWAHLFR